jgi:thiol-disulfide isomerase/thioredoxin
VSQVGPAVRSVVAALAALTALALLAGCTASEGPMITPESPPASPFAACPPPTSDAVTPAGAPLAGITLDCFTGGEPVALDRLGRPAVINLWASYCEPCRAEMPELQAFADEMGDRVLVLGVATADTWNAAAWAGIGFGVSYPNVFDPESTLQKALGRNGLPVTLLVTADGSVAATDVSGALTREKLHALVSENIGLD